VDGDTTQELVQRRFAIRSFYLAYFIFAALGSLVSVACAIPAMLFRGARARLFGQKLIHRLFAFFVGYLRGVWTD
jgi:hypothetical protein